MDNEESAGRNALERMLLDRSAEPVPLPLGLLQDITNSFSDDRLIGRGGFAVVYKGIVGHGMVAVKKLTKTYLLEEKKFDSELECLVKAKHKNIVRFLGYCAEIQKKVVRDAGKVVMADTRKWLLCSEFVPNGSLRDYIEDASSGLEWRERYEIIKGICEGLRCLHDNHILHLDLKPDNILIDNHMVPKITDFGLSRCLSDEQTHIFTTHLCGSRGYLAPEFFRGQLTFGSDIYSLGIVIVEILTGQKGYPEEENVVESWMNRLEGDMQLEQLRVCTKIGIECMKSDPKKRPAVRDIIDRLEKTACSVETDISGPSLEQQVSFERHCQQTIRNTPEDEIEGDAEQLETLLNDQDKEKQDTNEDRRFTSTPRSNSSVFEKLSNLDIFDRKSRRNFVRNGGPKIQQSNSLQIFREEELSPILDNGNLIAEGWFGEIYSGIICSRLVAVLKTLAVSMPLGEEFADALIARSQVIHENVQRPIGCCLEVDFPFLVYEDVSNGSLDDILHGNSKMPLDLGVRLRIAAQAADGLAYLHSKTDGENQFYGLEAANILLDDNFVPKISEFRISRWRDEQVCGYFFGGPASSPIGDYSVDQSALSTGAHFDGQPIPPSGAHFVCRPAPSNGGYYIGRPVNTDEPQLNEPQLVGISSLPNDSLPGDYFVGRPADQQLDGPRFIDSDAYNFGIIILELISRKKATNDDNNNLVRNFLESHEQGKKATTLFDKAITGRRELVLLDSLVEIAVECLSIDITLRPDMAEIAERLHRLSRKYTG